MSMIAICRASLQRVLRPIDRVSAQGASHNTLMSYAGNPRRLITVTSLLSSAVPGCGIPIVADNQSSPRQNNVGVQDNVILAVEG